MKTAHAEVATEFMLSLEAGVMEGVEVIRWADARMATEAYDDDVAEICVAVYRTDKELASLLRRIAGEETQWAGVRAMLGRMHEALVRDPNRLHDFTQFLERLWIRNDYEVPEDIHFVVGLEDDYLLAAEGPFGAVEEVRSRLLQNLRQFPHSMGE
jgi:hypothetical protein